MINNIYSSIDKQMDYIPVLSTVTNLINIIAKITLSPFKNETIEKSPCLTYINEKSYLKCMLLLIPFLGNIVLLLNELNDITNENYTNDTLFQKNKFNNLLNSSTITTQPLFNGTASNFVSTSLRDHKKQYQPNKKGYPKIPPFGLRISNN